jgi:hypothetical protein
MTTKPPAEIEVSNESNIVKKIYTAIDDLKELIPIDNDRNRLSYCLSMLNNDMIETLLNAIEQANPRSCKVDYLELDKKIREVFKQKDIELPNS